MLILKDYLNQELTVGDTVVFIEKYYRNFKTGTISKINKEKVTLEFPGHYSQVVSTCIYPSCVIKIKEQGE